MKNIKLALALPALALVAACGETAEDDTVDPDDSTVVAADGAMDADTTAPPVTTPTTDGMVSETVDDDGTNISMGEDGADVSIRDGNTTVDASINDKPSAQIDVD